MKIQKKKRRRKYSLNSVTWNKLTYRKRISLIFQNLCSLGRLASRSLVELQPFQGTIQTSYPILALCAEYAHGLRQGVQQGQRVTCCPETPAPHAAPRARVPPFLLTLHPGNEPHFPPNVFPTGMKFQPGERVYTLSWVCRTNHLRKSLVYRLLAGIK